MQKPSHIEIQIVEGILNEDVAAMRSIEREERELASIAEFVGKDDATTMRLWERMANINGMWVGRLHSFEWHCQRLQELRGFDFKGAAS